MPYFSSKRTSKNGKNAGLQFVPDDLDGDGIKRATVAEVFSIVCRKTGLEPAKDIFRSARCVHQRTGNIE